jgi:mono/diheme cytochrome c family protein
MKTFLMLTTFMTAALLLIVLTVTTPSLQARPFPAGEEGGEASDGKAVFLEAKCNLCHSVSSAEIEAKTSSEKLKGPDLSSSEPREAEWTAGFLRQEILDGDKKHKRPFKGTDEQLQTLIDWLQAQKTDSGE